MIHKTLDGGILLVTMEAAKGNMLDAGDIGALADCIRTAREEEPVKGILLTGAGLAFCAGLNLGGDKSGTFRLFDELLYELFLFPKPVVAAVNGHSVGGGLLLQACADYVVVADHARIKIGLPEVKLGLTIDRVMWELLSFSAKSGKQLTALLLTSQFVTPQEALDLGLADAMVPGETLPEAAREKLALLISMPAASYRITKQLAKRPAAERMKQGLEEEAYRIFNEIDSKQA